MGLFRRRGPDAAKVARKLDGAMDKFDGAVDRVVPMSNTPVEGPLPDVHTVPLGDPAADSAEVADALAALKEKIAKEEQ